MSKFVWHLKSVLNLIVFIILIAAGIILIIAGFALPTRPPFSIIGIVRTSDLIVSGVICIIISLGPFTTFFNRSNIERKIWKRWRERTLYELCLIDEQFCFETPSGYMVDDDHQNIQKQEYVYERFPPLPAEAKFNRESVFYQQSENLVHNLDLDCEFEDILEGESFFENLTDKVGCLHLPPKQAFDD